MRYYGSLKVFKSVHLTVLLRQLNDDALHFCVRLKAVLAQLATDSRLFEAAERRLSLQNVIRVDPD